MSEDNRSACPSCGELVLWARVELDGPTDVAVRIVPELAPHRAQLVVRRAADGGLLVRSRYAHEVLVPHESPAVSHADECPGEQLAAVLPFRRRAS